MSSESAESHGIITQRSPWPLDQTLQRLQSTFATKGLKIFADIDQQAEARAAGLDQPPMHLLLVGNPRAGTPIMAAVPQAELGPAVEGPHLGSADRHGLPSELVQGLRGLETLVKAILTV